jgi:peptide/nickel transport system substrate-binding protein
VIDTAGPWGTGPFTLAEGYSSINTRCAIMRANPFSCSWLIESEDRSDRLVLEANRNHWNLERGPRLERVVFRNALAHAEALELCLTTEGEVDIVTEVSPADAQRVLDSAHANLVRVDANRVLVGIINRGALDAPLADRRARQALNFAINRQQVIEQGLGGYANPLCALTPAWCGGFPAGAQPYAHDPERARQLMREAGWPEGRALRLAAPEAFVGLARMIGAGITAALDIVVEIIAIPPSQQLAGQRVLIEKKLALPWDVLLFGWFDLSSEAPPAAVHREFCGSDGAFRAGPVLPEFDTLYAEMAAQLDGAHLVAVAEHIDTYVYDEALALFLCAPQALYAVNKHVRFGAYRTTFELAETEVDEQHWSRRQARAEASATPAQGTDIPGVGDEGKDQDKANFSGASAGNAC